MKLSGVKIAMTRNVARKALLIKKNSPHIFFAAGVAGCVTSTVLACRATLKLNATLDEIKEDVDTVKGLKDNQNPDYNEMEWNKDLGYVYGKAGIKLAKLYGPSVLIGVASIGALSGSHVQLTRRNNALMAAYAAVQKAYDDYRERVREDLGEDKELDIYHAAKTESHLDGKKSTEVKVSDPNKWSPYARFFDEGSRQWNKDPELNRLYVQCQQNYANNLLQARGHIFLNEVYDMLDIERSKAGQVVGWVIGKDGDNYVDFGMLEMYNTDFVNGRERSILLDFNVDGVIYDKI